MSFEFQMWLTQLPLSGLLLLTHRKYKFCLSYAESMFDSATCLCLGQTPFYGS